MSEEKDENFTPPNPSSINIPPSRRHSIRRRSSSMSETGIGTTTSLATNIMKFEDEDNNQNDGHNNTTGITGGVINTLWAGASSLGNYVWGFWNSGNVNQAGNGSAISGEQNYRTDGSKEKIATARTAPLPTISKVSNPYLEETDPGIKLIGRTVKDNDEKILTQSMIDRIHAALPPRFRLCNTWKLLYGSPEHGYSLHTLFLRCRDHEGPILTVVRDDGGAIFGVFGTETWRPHFGHFGTGESFLWRQESNTGRLRRYSSTGRNAYYLMGETNYIAAGCGEGKFGFWLDGELLWGMSERVSTYDNDCLASNGRFKCCVVEVWGLDTSEMSP